MKKRIVKKQFNKIAKKSIRENSYLFNKYGMNKVFIIALNNYLHFILNFRCMKEIYHVSNMKIYINNCASDIKYNISLLDKMIHD